MGQSNEIVAPAASEFTGVSRRAMLGRAVGAAAGAVGASMLAAAPAMAASGDAVKAGNQTLAESTTEVRYDGAAGFTGFVLFANDSSYAASTTFYPAALGAWAGAGGAGGTRNGVYGYTDHGSGNAVIGINHGSTGEAGGAGVWGRSDTATTIGVKAEAIVGVALRVEGPASFSRSGRAMIPAGKKVVDVTVPGGLGLSSNVLANLQLYRSGVHVAACRRNYPSAGKVRIYLNKVASASHSTPVAWFVFG